MPTFKEFAANVGKHGLARTNRFQVIIPLPDKMSQAFANQDNRSPLVKAIGEVSKVIRIFTGPANTQFTRGLELMCSQTELPGKTINTTDTKYNGDTYKVGNSIMYGNQQFSFRVSADMYEKTIIDAWMNLIVNPATYEVGYYDDYTVPITINQLDTNDNIVHSVMLYDAYPVIANPLVLSNAEMGNVHELMTIFAYKRWQNLDLQEKKGGLLDKISQTPLGPYLTPILSNPVVQRGLEYVEQNTGLDIEGEAVGIYNQVNGVIENATGVSINKSASIMNGIKVDMQSNPKVTAPNKSTLTNYIDGALKIFG